MRRGELRGVRLAALATVTVCLIAPGAARADNLRCLTQPLNNPTADQQQVRDLWNAVGENASIGANGPLGCPVGNQITTITGFRLAQEFQRGWILVGGETKLAEAPRPGYVVAIRGIGQWWVWWDRAKVLARGRAGGRVGGIYDQQPIKDPVVGFGLGTVARVPDHESVALYGCPPALVCKPEGPAVDPAEPTAWVRVTPELTVPGPPIGFDFAAALDAGKLITPSASTVADRFAAAFPSWLPCYVVDPSLLGVLPPYPANVFGEDELARAILLARRTLPCPVTQDVPAARLTAWFSHAQTAFPDDTLPGSTVDDFPCSRTGELDVTLVGLLHLLYAYPAVYKASEARLLALLKPWGGPPRADPYVQPDGDCELIASVSVLETENHILLQEAARYLIDDLVTKHGDKTAGYDPATNGTKQWLVEFMRLLVRRDFYEFNALPYGRYDLKPLYLLSDYAPDPEVKKAATGVLDWLWAKYAISESMQRTSRPYRRRPEPKHYGPSEWLSPGMEALSFQALLLSGGGLQYLMDPANLTGPIGPPDPMKTVEDQIKATFTDLQGHRRLGALDPSAAAELADIADTTYRLPPAIASWLVQRYDQAADGVQFLQAIRHKEPDHDPYDKAKFVQWNDGAELYSGNRNWLISAGGVDVQPADPDAPPGTWGVVVLGALGAAVLGAALGSVFGPAGALFGAVVGLVVGGLFGSGMVKGQQHDALWKDQGQIMRPTSLIPSGRALDRSQILRYEGPRYAVEKQIAAPRMCVAEGFMCGFDLQFPSRALPDTFKRDQQSCPALDSGVPNLDTLVHDMSVNEGRLGCLLSMPGGLPAGEWTVWRFETGQVAVHTAHQPLSDAAWVVADTKFPERVVRVKWHVANSYDWYRVYFTAADGGHQELRIDGDPDNPSKHSDGQQELCFGKAPCTETPATSFRITVDGCDKKWRINLGIKLFSYTRCDTAMFPVLDVNVAPLPAETFSCDYDKHGVDDPVNGQATVFSTACGGSYGAYIYVYEAGCRKESGCPPGARQFGFVIAAPKSGFDNMAQFARRVDESIIAREPAGGWTAGPGAAAEIDVPYGREGTHRVRFNWLARDTRGWSILADTDGAEAMVSALGTNINDWPPAASSASEWGTRRGEVIDAKSSDGCFTVTGLPGQPEPNGLVVDLRATPRVETLDSGKVAGAC